MMNTLKYYTDPHSRYDIRYILASVLLHFGATLSSKVIYSEHVQIQGGFRGSLKIEEDVPDFLGYIRISSIWGIHLISISNGECKYIVNHNPTEGEGLAITDVKRIANQN